MAGWQGKTPMQIIDRRDPTEGRGYIPPARSMMGGDVSSKSATVDQGVARTRYDIASRLFPLFQTVWEIGEVQLGLEDSRQRNRIVARQG